IYKSNSFQATCEVVDLVGTVVQESEVKSSDGRFDVDITNLRSGLYMIRLTLKDETVFLGKFFRQ
ncbi:MAG: T9SS type A sorting domain-containing protein, partial [Bacteroidetes bacterium]|nr:T9SS type A sorting domain-containing protein [Bacteroidota bacterium]